MRNSRQVVFGWATKMKLDKRKAVEDSCKTAMNLWGYVRFYHFLQHKRIGQVFKFSFLNTGTIYLMETPMHTQKKCFGIRIGL